MKSRKETATAFIMGKRCTASNFTTDGQEATSFDTVIAAHVGRAVLIKDVYTFVYWGERLTGRTRTTERQKAAIVWAAHLAKVPAFVVPNIGILGEHTHRENLEFLRAEAKECREKAKRARLEENRIFWAERAEEKTKTANRYYKLFLTA